MSQIPYGYMANSQPQDFSLRPVYCYDPFTNALCVMMVQCEDLVQQYQHQHEQQHYHYNPMPLTESHPLSRPTGNPPTERQTMIEPTSPDVTEDEDKQTCAICLEDIEADRKSIVSQLACQHTFHGQCVGRWLASNDSCPLCRGGI